MVQNELTDEIRQRKQERFVLLFLVLHLKNNYRMYVRLEENVQLSVK